MSISGADTRLDCLVREAVANYGSYTATVPGLGEGLADRVLEINVDSEDLTHAYTRAPFNQANKIPPGCRFRRFVYMIPIEQRYGQEQRICVGWDGEDLDVAMFFRPSSPASDTVYLAMPPQAFSGPGAEVQYAFRVRNYFECPNGVLEPRDDLQIGMELTTSSQAKHPRRGVVLITNSQLFSFQLSVMGDKQAGFKMQYDPAQVASTDSKSQHSLAMLYTQVFGSIVVPPTLEEIMTNAIKRHYNTSYFRGQAKGGGGATRSCARAGGATRSSGSSLSHAKLSAGEEKHWNLSVSESVPISKRSCTQLSLMVGDIKQAYVPDLEQSSVPPALPVVLFAPTATQVDTSTGYDKSMLCLERIRVHGIRSNVVTWAQLAQLQADMYQWPVRDGYEALAVGVREHECRDDEEGEDISATFIDVSKRVYTVQEGVLLRVRITNMSLTDKWIIVYPYYCNATSECGTSCFEEQSQGYMSLKAGESYQMPYPIQKEAGEGRDGWMLKDADGNTLLTLLFQLPAAPEPARIEDDHVAFHALQPARDEDKMVIDTEAEASGEKLEPKEMEPDKIEPECCICLNKKTVGQMAAFIPCGHCVCCIECYSKQVKADTAVGKRSTCPKCRVAVRDTMRLFF